MGVFASKRAALMWQKIKNWLRSPKGASDTTPHEMKYLIVGLGNIGSEYAHTRHNVGFDVLDHLAGEAGISFEDGRYGLTAQHKHKGRQLTLLKPSTYVNLSGDRKSTRLNSSHVRISYAVFCLKKKKKKTIIHNHNHSTDIDSAPYNILC